MIVKKTIKILSNNGKEVRGKMIIKPLQVIPKKWQPSITFDLPELQFPEEFNFTEELLERRLEFTRDRVAILYLDEQITYGEIAKRVNKFANVLQNLGIGHGDVVMLRIPDCPEFVVCSLAVHKVGAVWLPTVPLLREKTITYIAAKAKAKMLIVAEEVLEEVEKGRDKLTTIEKFIAVDRKQGAELKRKGYLLYRELMATASEEVVGVKVHRDELAVITFTGGTTGTPKGLMHDASALLAVTTNSLCLYPPDFGPGDVVAGTPPLAFTFGYIHKMLIPFLLGATVAYIFGRATVESCFEIIQKHKVTGWWAAPAMFKMMLDYPRWNDYDLSSVKIFYSSSAAILPNIIEQWKRRYERTIVNLMGSNETLGSFIATWHAPFKPGSLGYPYPGYRLAIIDKEGNELKRGEVGLLGIKGPTGPMLLDDLEGQKKAVINGWGLTGDSAYIDEDGCFWHTSRADDVIKSRGYRVSPEEVENTLTEHPAVKEAAVIGIPDEVKGQAVKAYVVLRAKEEASEELAQKIKDFARERLAPYMGPHEIEFTGEIPKTELLKINRKALRELSAKK
jgi:2-aminobenzoate-CoA ligase